MKNPHGDVRKFQHELQCVTFAYTPPKQEPLLDEERGFVTKEALQAGGSEDGSFDLATDERALPGCSYMPLGPFTTWKSA